MKSIKPGRGPSMMGAFGSVAAVIFGVIWMCSAVNMGAPSFFIYFGVIFIALGIMNVVYNFKNATGKNRFSAFDITDGNEEKDPLGAYFEKENKETSVNFTDQGETSNFCPYCGGRVEEDFLFCRKCGKQLPQ